MKATPRAGDARPRLPHVSRQQRGLLLLLSLSLLAAAAVTLRPMGSGWAWGSPAAELWWYLSWSDDARGQLVGNVLLLAPSAALAVALWPSLARRPLLPRVPLIAGTSIELLQWALPLGRVVSPLDAVLNAVGACAAALLATAALPSAQHRGPARHRGLLEADVQQDISQFAGPTARLLNAGSQTGGH